jgi:hypothetical protein
MTESADSRRTSVTRSLLSKPSAWASEEEIRFVSQRHSISVAIDRARVSCVFLGRGAECGGPRQDPAVSGSRSAIAPDNTLTDLAMLPLYRFGSWGLLATQRDG